MILEAKLNLDEILVGEDWDITIGEMIRDELKIVIRAEIKKAVKDDPDIKKAIATMKRVAANQILSSLGPKT